MKTTVLLIFILSLFSSTEIKKEGKEYLPSNDKEFLLDYFQQTTNNLKQSVKGLSEAQMQYKAAPDKWSISQCLEHIILTEKALFEMSQELMKKPANPARRKDVKVTDEDLMAGITNRSKKAKATKDLEGKGRYTDPKQALNDLMKERSKVLNYISNTSAESMRNHIDDSPFGAIDAYQSFIFIAGHSARHTLQIEEVKSSPGFPD